MHFQAARKEGFNSLEESTHYPAQRIVKIKVDICTGATLGYTVLLCGCTLNERWMDSLQLGVQEGKECLLTNFFQIKVILISISHVDS